MCRALCGGRLDGDKARYGGLGVLRAVGNVNGEIAGALLGRGFAACLHPLIAIEADALSLPGDQDISVGRKTR